MSGPVHAEGRADVVPPVDPLAAPLDPFAALAGDGLSEAPDCARLAAEAGAAEGLPEGLLPAISLVETGKGDGQGGRMPWPWTLNQGGDSHYLDSAAEALAKLDAILATGTTNVDVGCMQLNWKWHSEAFASRADMLDPVQNTAYAARFLKELKNQLGSWELATAAYHSTDPDRGQAYAAKVSAAQETMIALLPMLPEGQSPSVLLSAVPMRLQGLLALAGSPMFTAAAERAALVGARTVEAAADMAAAPPAFAPGEDEPRPVAPDLPMVIAATETASIRFDNAPRRLRDRWADVEQMRQLLAPAP
ncbi:MAG: invasion protein [Rhodobacteraceae bacterium PARR1]|nr:MAG: invasion protein [Rhodobacteraceae bacterium PARR1]